MHPSRPLFAVLVLLVIAAPGLAQPAAPPPPQRYNVALRYRITSPRDQHVAIYDSMIAHLKAQGFEFIPPYETFPKTDREDRSKNVITGTIASDRFLKLFTHGHIEALRLTRPEFKEPPPDQRVRVRLELASGFPATRQRVLADQVRVLLAEVGFLESVGYDQRGYTGRPHTRLVGTIPAGQLPTLLTDLRFQPSGWLAPRISPEDLPSPLRETSPILVTEVIPEPSPAQAPPVYPPRPDAVLNKVGDDLFPLVMNKAEQDRVERLEVILSYAPGDRDRVWSEQLAAAAPSIFIEGRLGAYVTCLARVGQARALAALDIVSTVRLARPPRVAVDPDLSLPADNDRALEQSGLKALHQRGLRGKGVRVAVIDSDFEGHEALVKSGRLPAGTRLLDLTAQRTFTLFPEPPPADPKRLGHGTRCALALALAAPDSDLTLIRIDPAAPHMLRELAGYLRGETVTSTYLELRLEELVTDLRELKRRRLELLEERQLILERFDDEQDFDRQYGILGNVGAWLFSDRRWHQLRLEEWERDDRQYRQRELRYLKLMKELTDLRNIEFVSCSLAWNDGYPLGGSSPLSRWLDDSQRPCAMWFQSAGNTGGQTWNGSFRDEDGNGVLEFAPATPPNPPRIGGGKGGVGGRWTRELNFLAWRPFGAEVTPDLPAGAKVRVSMQWREPHEPDFFFRLGDPDRYRVPLAQVRLMVLRQRDPDGKVLPADDMEVVAYSHALPHRLDNQPNSSTYELAVEFVAAKGGRYALRLERLLPTRWTLFVDPDTGREAVGLQEGLVPTGLKPPGITTLPAFEKSWELRPRLFVEAVEDSLAGKGQVIFPDFPTAVGGVGMPGDARSLVTVGAANLKGKAQPYSASGPPPNLDLAKNPDAFAFDRLDLGKGQGGIALGTSLATPFAAGLAATLRSAGMTRQQLQHYLQQRPGTVFVAPRR
ncbi:MAG: S8 family serine peptidase [Gemmataceae bacterium]|nr:S8 family serine peptidase [Gemmataceae bacterium]